MGDIVMLKKKHAFLLGVILCFSILSAVNGGRTELTLPWIQNFDTWPIQGWVEGGSRRWDQYNDQSIYCRFQSWSSGTAELSTPILDIPDVPAVVLEFDWSHQYHPAFPNDEFKILISDDQGNNWNTVLDLKGVDFHSNDGATMNYPGSYAHRMVDISQYADESIIIKFLGTSGNGTIFCLDNLEIKAITALPSQVVNVSPADNSLDIRPFGEIVWERPDDSCNIILSLGTDNPPSNVVDGLLLETTSRFRYHNLLPDTDYYVKIVSQNPVGACQNNQIYTFRTSTEVAETLPAEYNFDNGIPQNWTNEIELDNEEWIIRTAMYYGADQDHTTGNGLFLAFDDSGRYEKAEIYTSAFDLTNANAPQLSFWYEIGNSSYVSELEIQIYDGNDWFAIPQRWSAVYNWTEAVVDLSQFSGVILMKIVAYGSIMNSSDVCLDDFRVFDTAVIPECVQIVTPSDMEQGMPINGTLKWQTLSDISEYHLYIGTSSDNYDIVNDQVIVGSEYTYYNFTPGSTYYWKVLPGNDIGVNDSCPEREFSVSNTAVINCPWSEYISVSLPQDWINDNSNEYNDFVVTSGAMQNGATGDHTTGSGYYLSFQDVYVSGSMCDSSSISTNIFDVSNLTNPMLNFYYWIGTLENADHSQSELEIKVCNGSDVFNAPIVLQYNPEWSQASIDLAGMGDSLSFIFKAKGSFSRYSDVCLDDFSITDNTILPDPTALISPVNLATHISKTTTLSWQVSPGASFYKLFLGSESGVYNIVNGYITSSNSYDCYPLNDYTDYFWKVVACNSVGESDETSEWTFKTETGPVIDTFPWQEDFSSWPLTNWSLSGDRSWYYDSDGFIVCRFWGWSSGTASLHLPDLSIPNGATTSISFNWSHEYDPDDPDDVGMLQISLDGNSWADLWYLTGADFESNDGSSSMDPGSYVTETISLDEFAGQTVQLKFTGISGWGKAFFLDNIQINTIDLPKVKLKTKVILEGPYNPETGLMNTDLATNNFIPLTSPYIDAVSVESLPLDVVDWVFIELRHTPNGPTVDSSSGLLLNNGMIVDHRYSTDQALNYIEMKDSFEGDFYVVVRHRNHIDIISSVPHSLTSSENTTPIVDLVNSPGNVYTESLSAVTEVSQGVYAMNMGDIDKDGSILSNDFFTWVIAFDGGTSDGYIDADVDMNGSLLSNDNTLWLYKFSNNTLDCQVP